MYMDTEANIAQWFPVPKTIRILSYYIFNEDKTGFMFKNDMFEIGGNE